MRNFRKIYIPFQVSPEKHGKSRFCTIVRPGFKRLHRHKRCFEYSKEVVAKIKEAGADYVLPIKGNHPGQLEDIKLFFDDAIKKDFMELLAQKVLEKLIACATGF